MASQIAISASPIFAAVVFFAAELESLGVDSVQLLFIAILSSLIAGVLAALVTDFFGKDSKDDFVYQGRLVKGQIKERGHRQHLNRV